MMLNSAYLTSTNAKNDITTSISTHSYRAAFSAVTSSFGAPVQTSIMGPQFLVQNVQLGYFLQYRNHCVSLGFFDDSVL